MANTILAMKANLFPDGHTVETTLRELAAVHDVRFFVTVTPDAMYDQAWDQILAEILSVEKVITI